MNTNCHQTTTANEQKKQQTTLNTTQTTQPTHKGQQIPNDARPKENHTQQRTTSNLQLTIDHTTQDTQQTNNTQR